MDMVADTLIQEFLDRHPQRKGETSYFSDINEALRLYRAEARKRKKWKRRAHLFLRHMLGPDSQQRDATRRVWLAKLGLEEELARLDNGAQRRLNHTLESGFRQLYLAFVALVESRSPFEAQVKLGDGITALEYALLPTTKWSQAFVRSAPRDLGDRVIRGWTADRCAYAAAVEYDYALVERYLRVWVTPGGGSSRSARDLGVELAKYASTVSPDRRETWWRYGGPDVQLQLSRTIAVPDEVVLAVAASD